MLPGAKPVTLRQIIRYVASLDTISALTEARNLSKTAFGVALARGSKVVSLSLQASMAAVARTTATNALIGQASYAFVIGGV